MLCDFEKKVEASLAECGVLFDENLKIGAAVSGGADSVSLLLSLSSLLKSLSIPLCVITINHNIREKSETEGDAVFVEDLCRELEGAGCNIKFTCVTFEKNQVLRINEERKGGIEEAARFLRYEAFEKFIRENNLDFLCLAHNKNDQLETLLMRFLRGSGVDGLCGIKMKREKFIRPLLNIERREIEEYLNSKNQNWRTDSTNSDQAYYRNKIRLSLVPFLNENFPGWANAVLSGQKKAVEDSEFINWAVEMFSGGGFGTPTGEMCSEGREFGSPVRECGSLTRENTAAAGKLNLQARANNPFTSAAPFPAILKRRILKVLNNDGIACRVPDAFLNELCEELNAGKSTVKKSFAGYEIVIKNGEVLVKKAVKKHTDLVFFDIIEDDGSFSFPFGTLDVIDGKIFINENLVQCSVKMPFCIRNVTSGDVVAAADGSYKKVRDIFSDWHVLQEHRELIPLILNVQSGEVVCIPAAFLGYNDWVVKNEK